MSGRDYDLDGYLTRIGHGGRREPTLAVLRAIVAAHTAYRVHAARRVPRVLGTATQDARCAMARISERHWQTRSAWRCLMINWRC